jgi:hypothetical protein
LEENIRKVKLSTPDYRDMDPEAAVVDFKQRRENYMRVYETVAEADGSYIKIINSKQFIGTSTSSLVWSRGGKYLVIRISFVDHG